MDSLQKHFIRWCSNKLLPAALMSERPNALAVARAITGAEMLPPNLDDEGVEIGFYSDVHGKMIFISKFEEFLRHAVASVNAGVGVGAPVYTNSAKEAAAKLLQGVDFRDKENYKKEPLVSAPLLYCDCCLDPCQLIWMPSCLG